MENAHSRIAAATPEIEKVTLPGICRGVLLESWKFDFVPDGQAPITGKLAEGLPEDAAKAMLALTDHRAEARFKVTRIRTQTGLGRPTYELLDIKPAS